MGFLHEGHMSLVKKLQGRCDVKVVSIFVNPAQFGPNEDFSRYPRDEDRDVKMLTDAGIDVIFIPDGKEIYPDGFQTFVEVDQLSTALCGRFRPGHFRGVATVVFKLFNVTGCDCAVFGLKDFQQTAVISRMVKDFHLPVDLILSPTLREDDGLAMSSRNSLLSEIERKSARAIPRALEAARKAAAGGEVRAARIVDIVRREIAGDPSILIQYIEVVDPETLQGVEKIKGRAQLAVAVFSGKTRLIDNVAIGAGGDVNPILEGMK